MSFITWSDLIHINPTGEGLEIQRMVGGTLGSGAQGGDTYYKYGKKIKKNGVESH